MKTVDRLLARDLLQLYLNGNVLPVSDAIVHKEWGEGSATIYTFKGLLKIAYNLKDEDS